jgi:uncharacterized membrane protein YidH (DUF202 family)
MFKRFPTLANILAVVGLCPTAAFAQGQDAMPDMVGTSSSPFIFLVGMLLLALLLARFGMGVINLCFLEEESLASIERRHPYLPRLRATVSILLATALMVVLSLKTIAGIAPFDGPNGAFFAVAGLCLFGLFAVVARYLWPDASKQYVFAALTGTVITFALIGFERSVFSPLSNNDPFVITMGLVCIIVAWQFLFGPWRPPVKAFVLGTFIFWVTIHMLFAASHAERLAQLLAAGIALIPAIVWCMLFLGYHKQRISMVLLMFFSGMLSTAPILLYDKVLRSGLELQFFLFRIVPESFTQTSNTFVSERIGGGPSYQSTIVATFVSFLLVGLIEELSKFWVLKKSGSSSFRSIDDVMQLGIIVAIGFAFAENVLNPNYFLSFVKEHLVGASPDWAGFLGNFLGRSILTNMVHIVSTGIFGYYFGLALFSRSYMNEDRKVGKRIFLPRFLHYVLRLPEEEVFQREMALTGMVVAVCLHGVFNFLVTLPSLLPENPRTIGELVDAAPGSPLHFIAILIVPALFYVVGGFWLLTTLFSSERNMKERTVKITQAAESAVA